jgi:hypothetical protein
MKNPGKGNAMSVLKLWLGLLLVLVLPAASFAQSGYPSRPVRIVVGFGPGSAADLSARVVVQRLSKTMGQQFIVENKPGGGAPWRPSRSRAARRMATRCSWAPWRT